MAYHKRRIQPAPNKNQAKVLRRESSGRSFSPKLETLDPNLERISLRFEFYDANGNMLEQRAVSANANESIDLVLDCVGPCGNGQTSLEGKLKDLLQRQQTVSEGKSKCGVIVHAGSNEVCGYELRCHFDIQYKS